MTAIRRPVLKIVESNAGASADQEPVRIQHDARGNAIWSGTLDLEDTGDLSLAADPTAKATVEGDPYNRSLSPGAPRGRG